MLVNVKGYVARNSAKHCSALLELRSECQCYKEPDYFPPQWPNAMTPGEKEVLIIKDQQGGNCGRGQELKMLRGIRFRIT